MNRSRGILALAVLGIAAPVFGQLRFVSYNVAQLNGDNNALRDVFEELIADDTSGFAVAPGVIVFQEVQNNDASPLLTLLNQAAPPGTTYALGTYTNDNEDFAAGAQALAYRTDLLTELAGDHDDIFTGAGRDADRWHLRLLDYDANETRFYIYSAHLKAGSSEDDASLRLSGAEAIRGNADSLAATTNIIYAGDWNLSSNGEDAYLEFLGAGNGQASDPLGNGSWGGSSNAIKHTQSPRLPSAGGLTGGGMDDRFDFVLMTPELNDGLGLSLIPGTYRALGNDGQHYNESINDGNNTYFPGDVPRSNALADDLFDASDHLPVVVDFQLPARLEATISVTDRVIRLANVQAVIEVTNTADVVVPAGADSGDYTVTGSGNLVSSCNGTAAPLAGPDTCMLVLQTGTVGPFTASASLTSSSTGAQIEDPFLQTTGTVVEHANPSLAPDTDVNLIAVPFVFEADTGLQPIDIDVYNHQFTALQALLDVDAIGGLAAPVGLAAPLPTGIGGSPGTIGLSFDTDGLTAGEYDAVLTLDASDEDLPGADTYLLVLSLEIDVTAGPSCLADVDGSGQVDVDDLVEVILQWGTADPAADVNDDGIVDVDDLVEVILQWGCTG